MDRFLKIIQRITRKSETKDNPTPISNVENINIEVTNNKNEDFQNKNVTRYAYGDINKIRTIDDLEDFRKKQNEENREEYIKRIKDLSISINPQTGKKYTCREIGLIMNCSRTTVSNILNNKSSGKYASVRVGENTAF